MQNNHTLAKEMSTVEIVSDSTWTWAQCRWDKISMNNL